MKWHYIYTILLPFTFTLFTILISIRLLAQDDSIVSRIVLIGDAGALVKGKQPVIDAVRKTIPMDKKTTILYLGDNLYKDGLPAEQAPNYLQARVQLDSQLFIAKGMGASVYMIPGNHDWDNGSAKGFAAVFREQQYVRTLNDPNVNYYPQDGCPGPVLVDINNDIKLVLFDSQWWLHKKNKPGIESDCECKTKEDVLKRLDEIVTEHADKLIVFACHHPFKSNGIHGGYFQFKQHIFPFTDLKPNLYIPLPLIGSIYPISRSVFGTPQDLKNPRYINMINNIESVVNKHPNLLFVNGHEHNLQLLQENSHYYIISGAGCKSTRVRPTNTSKYVYPGLGFALLEATQRKNLQITFYEVLPNTVHKSFHQQLLNYSHPEKPDTARRVQYAGPN